MHELSREVCFKVKSLYLLRLAAHENVWIRCIVPDKEVYTITRANLHPTLQAWFKESNADEFVENILLQKYSK